MCVVTFKQEGDRRGIIEQIKSLILGRDFPESFERSQFKVHLTSGDTVIVPGSAISAIESTTALANSTPTKRKPGISARKARVTRTLTEKRKSIATKASKPRARKAKQRKSAQRKPAS
jgi:hypothetical protein